MIQHKTLIHHFVEISSNFVTEHRKVRGKTKVFNEAFLKMDDEIVCRVHVLQNFLDTNPLAYHTMKKA